MTAARRLAGPALLSAALLGLWILDGALERRAYGRVYSDGVIAADAILGRRPARRDFWLVTPDPDLLWRYRAGVAVDLEMFTVGGPRRYRIEANAEGFRAGPFGPKAEGELRVVALGDSRTMGAGVEPGKAWPGALEALLRRRRGGRPVRVLNLGVDGYSTFQGAALMRTVVPGLAPDWVIAAFDVNDASLDGPLSHAARAAAANRTLLKIQAWLHRSALYLTLADRLRPLPDLAEDAAAEAGAVANVSEGEFRDNLVEIGTRTAALGAKALFLRIPLGGAFKTPPEEDELSARVGRLFPIREEAAARTGAGLADASGRFAGAPYETLYLESIHPAPEGHRRVAEVVLAAIFDAP